MNVYVYQAALLCEDCGRARRFELARAGEAPENMYDEESYDSDDFPKGSYADGGGEADTPQHCDMCSVFLENPLTSEGVRYVREKVRDAYLTKNYVGNREVVYEWKHFYDYIDFGLEPSDDTDESIDAIECVACGKRTLPVEGEIAVCSCGALLSTDDAP